MEITTELRRDWEILQKELVRLGERVQELEKENEELKEEASRLLEERDRYSTSLRQAINPKPYKRPGFWKVWSMARELLFDLEKITSGKLKGQYILSFGEHNRVYKTLKDVWDIVSPDTISYCEIFPTIPDYRGLDCFTLDQTLYILSGGGQDSTHSNDVTQELLDLDHPPRLPKRYPSLLPKFVVPDAFSERFKPIVRWWKGETHLERLDRQQQEQRELEKEEWREQMRKYENYRPKTIFNDCDLELLPY